MNKNHFIAALFLIQTGSFQLVAQEAPPQLTGYWIHTGTRIDSAACSPELLEQFREEERIVEAEEYSENWPPTENIFIDSDSLAWMDYPCQLYEKAFCIFSSDSIYLYTKRNPGQLTKINENSLQLISHGCIISTYKRPVVNADIMKVLNDLYVNPACFLGVFKLKTHFTPEYPAYDEEHVSIPPIKIQKEINLSSYEAAYKLISTGEIYLKSGNTTRLFYLSWHEFCNYDQECVYRVILTPGEWWTGEPFDLEYRLEEK